MLAVGREGERGVAGLVDVADAGTQGLAQDDDAIRSVAGDGRSELDVARGNAVAGDEAVEPEGVARDAAVVDELEGLETDDIGVDCLVGGDVGAHGDAAVGDGGVAGLARAEDEFARTGEGVGGKGRAIEVERLETLVAC